MYTTNMRKIIAKSRRNSLTLENQYEKMGTEIFKSVFNAHYSA
jgi:hypothetical protein